MIQHMKHWGTATGPAGEVVMLVVWKNQAKLPIFDVSLINRTQTQTYSNIHIGVCFRTWMAKWASNFGFLFVQEAISNCPTTCQFSSVVVFLVKPSQFTFSIFPLFQTQMNNNSLNYYMYENLTATDWVRTPFFSLCFSSPFFSMFLPFFSGWTISFPTFHSKIWPSFHHQSFPPSPSRLQGGLRLLSDAAGDGGGPPAGLSQRSWDGF